MTHLTILPILVPMLAGILLLLPPSGKNLKARRFTSLTMALVSLFVAGLLFNHSLTGEIAVYAIGNWQAPYGIVLVADIMASMLVLLTSFLALCCVIYSLGGDDEAGSFFHPLLHFLLLGVNGAFLTGDLFNLFVFFEVLLIASYALLMHSSDKQKTQAAIHYVVLNLIGSSIFLIALGIMYGVLGTLNIADMAHKIATLSGDDVALVKIGGLLLLVVFALKAAVIPLQFWLPATYSAALPVVAAMFAIMTKVGVYSIIRVYNTVFGEQAGELTQIDSTWLWPAALVTIAFGTLGVLAAKGFRQVIANLVVVSVGTLVAAVTFNSQHATGAALYYLIHSTLITAGLFLLAGLVAKQRGKVGDRLVPARPIANPMLLGSCFILLVLSVVGMPPLSGFVGKVWLLQASMAAELHTWFWPLYLVSSLLVLISMTRAGSQLFWRHSSKQAIEVKLSRWQISALLLVASCAPLLSLFAGVISDVTMEAAAQIHDVSTYSNAVLGKSMEGR